MNTLYFTAILHIHRIRVYCARVFILDYVSVLILLTKLNLVLLLFCAVLSNEAKSRCTSSVSHYSGGRLIGIHPHVTPRWPWGCGRFQMNESLTGRMLSYWFCSSNNVSYWKQNENKEPKKKLFENTLKDSSINLWSLWKHSCVALLFKLAQFHSTLKYNVF